MQRLAAVLGILLLIAPVKGYAQTDGCVPKRDRYLPYSLEGDSATFVVSSRGNVLIRPDQPVDEDDRVVVWVITTPAEGGFIRVRRTSPFRTPGTISLIGIDDISVTGALAINGSGECVLHIVLTDFAPGRGEVELERLEKDPTGYKTTSLGKFDFGVNSLYSGAVTFGPARTSLVDQYFAVVQKGTESVVTQTSGGDQRIVYVVWYTPFIWGKRDVDKPTSVLWHHINPTLGFAVKNFNDNAFIGASVDLPLGVFLTAGFHVGKVSELDDTTGAVLGKSYAGSSVPTRSSWKRGNIASVSIDLRIAVKLLKAAASSSLQ